jgi:membrane fusion protein (multidrug efflux system)
MPPTRVVTAEVRQEPVSENLSLVGSIAANEMVEVKSETEGIVQEILFEEGQKVAKGDLLVRLDESKFAARLREAEANFRLSQTTYERSRQLYADKLISQQEFDQASAVFEVNRAGVELMHRQLKDARIFAPFSGTLGAREVSPGQVMTRNTTLTWLVDLDIVKVEIDVPERFLGQIRLGQSIEVKVAAFGNRKFRGDVFFIDPKVAPATRTALVKARIANPDHLLKPGMFAALDLTLQLRDSAIVIPEIALMSDGDRYSVFVVDGESMAQVRRVSIGERLAGKVEILDGLKAGESVVVEGLQKVVPGAKVESTMAATDEPTARS